MVKKPAYFSLMTDVRALTRISTKGTHLCGVGWPKGGFIMTRPIQQKNLEARGDASLFVYRYYKLAK
jgi:hypothetical protein